jgi:hypothetical protein
MFLIRLTTLAALTAAPLLAAPTDTMMVRKSHTESSKTSANETPAKDVTQTVWISKDRVRVDADDSSILVRLDQKKVYLIDPKDKSYSAIDLPFDMKKYLPPEMTELYEKMKASNPVAATVTPTEETKKIGQWTAKKYQVSIQGGFGGNLTEELWTTKDIAIDASAFLELMRLKASLMPGGETAAEELKKISGVPVMSDRTQGSGPGAIKTHDELVSIESKDAPDGTFEVPKDFTEKPFDPRAMAMGGRRPPGPPNHPGAKGADSKKPPPDKQ